MGIYLNYKMPYKPQINKETGKKQQIKLMFNQIAKRYDFLNHFLSFGIDAYWRKKIVRLIKQELKYKGNEYNNLQIIDLATGTGDLAIVLNKLKPNKIFGIDISERMLQLAIKKTETKKLANIEFKITDAEDLPFEDNSFHVAAVAFGIRNFENLNKGLSETWRVLKENGIFAILEFSKPTNSIFKLVYNFYFNNILPWTGKVISENNYAYKYLPNSVKYFPEKEELIRELKEANFKNIKMFPLTFDIVTIYIAYK